MQSHSGMIFRGKTKELGGKPVSVPLCPPEILYGLTWVQEIKKYKFRVVSNGQHPYQIS
jgi:hypothetical protein